MAQMEESVKTLQLKSAALADPTAETKQWIRSLAINAKNENRMDIVTHLRQIVPAGTTGELTLIVNSSFSHCLSVIHLYYPTKLSAWTCFFAFISAVLAQSVERVTAEREVAGPIPGAGPILQVLK